MATYRRDVYLPPKQIEPLDGRPVGTRLGHEHDMNDALWARLDWQKKYTNELKGLEKKDEVKAHHKVINFLVWSNVYFLIMLLILKFGLRVL